MGRGDALLHSHVPYGETETGIPQFSPLKSVPIPCLSSDIHPAALPPEHTIVFLVRLLPETPREAFALWQMMAEDFQPILGVLLDGDSGPHITLGSWEGWDPCLLSLPPGI